MQKSFSGTTLLMLTAILLQCGCASYHIRQGNRLYNSMAYHDAIPEYQKGLSKKSNAQAQHRLAECYLKTNDLAKAEEMYGKVLQDKSAAPEDRLRYAQLLMRSGKYDQAKTNLDQYMTSMPNDTTARYLRQGLDSIEAWKVDSAKYSIEPSKLNTTGSNFSPVWYKDGVMFASDRSGGRVHEWTGRPYLDLYYAKMDQQGNFAAPTKLSGTVNGVYHEGPATFTPDWDTIYFTRNNYMKKKVKFSDDDVVNIKICRAVRKDTVWDNVTDFAYNSLNYNTAHPVLSHDGKTMYFVSDMPGGRGGTDIYVTNNVDSQWSKPVALGPEVNTPYDELFPMLWHDTVLYFSSYGHYNMGGLDVFKCTKTASGWSEALNMGYPLNTSYDDFGIALNDTGTSGLISSNRNSQNTTQDAIYGFGINDLRFTLEGIAVNKKTQVPLSGVVVELTNETTKQKELATTGEDGKFFFKLERNSNFNVVGSRDGYFTNKEPVTTIGKDRSETMFVKLKLELEEIVVNKPIVLENIYYDLDKSDIRPDAAAGLDKLVNILNDNPTIKVELSSHTDSRADDRYNMKLSQRRAESAVNYIIAHGISKDRIVAKGYGESQLINRCSNNVKCTEEEHQQNRRTEFKVTSLNISQN